MAVREAPSATPDAQIAHPLIHHKTDRAIDAGGGKHSGDSARDDDQRHHLPHLLGHQVNPPLQVARNEYHIRLHFADGVAHCHGTGQCLCAEAHGEKYARRLERAVPPDSGIVATPNAQRRNIAHYSDHTQFASGKVIIWPTASPRWKNERASALADHDVVDRVGPLQIAAPNQVHAERAHETRSGGINVDGLNRIGPARWTNLHGERSDHGHIVGDGDVADGGDGAQSAGDAVEARL